MKRFGDLHPIVHTILGLAGIVGLAYLGWVVLRGVWNSYLSTLDKSILAALVVASVGLLGTVLVKYIEYRHSVRAAFRDKKVTIFHDFLDILRRDQESNVNQDELFESLRKWRRELLFWSDSNVVRIAFSLLASQKRETVQEYSRHMERVGNLMLAMRKDAGLSNRRIMADMPAGMSRGLVLGARYMLRDPDFFLAALKENPLMSARKLAELEEERWKSREIEKGAENDAMPR